MVSCRMVDYNKLYPSSALTARPQGPSEASPAVTLPDTDDIVVLTRACAGMAVRQLVDIAKTGPAAARVAACNSLLDRGYGKPGQSVTVYQGAAERKSAWADVQAMFDDDIEGEIIRV